MDRNENIWLVLVVYDGVLDGYVQKLAADGVTIGIQYVREDAIADVSILIQIRIQTGVQLVHFDTNITGVDCSVRFGGECICQRLVTGFRHAKQRQRQNVRNQQRQYQAYYPYTLFHTILL